jgi:hypothetical protein
MTKYGLCLAAAAVLLLSSPIARAQIGSGWEEYHPSSTIHLDGKDGIETSSGSSTNVKNEGASFSKAGGIETFTLFDPISNRAERRMKNEYTSGRWQFEGEVRVSPPTNNESVMQIFGGTSGATTQMIRAYNSGGGTLKKVPGSVVLATGIHGEWIRLNVIHDVEANNVKTYVDGKLMATGPGEAPAKWYHKYGCYGSLKTESAKVEWRNVKHFRHKDNDAQAAEDLGEGPLGLNVDYEPPEPAGWDTDSSVVLEQPGAPQLGCAFGHRAPAPWALLIVAVALLVRRRLHDPPAP